MNSEFSERLADLPEVIAFRDYLVKSYQLDPHFGWSMTGFLDNDGTYFFRWVGWSGCCGCEGSYTKIEEEDFENKDYENSVTVENVDELDKLHDYKIF